MEVQKIIFVGDTCTGKTTAYNLLLNKINNDNNKTTIGMNVGVLRNYTGKIFHVYDFGGNNKYNIINNKYFHNIYICVLFDDKKNEWRDLIKLYSPNCIFYDFLTFEYLKEFIDSI
jgi:signal recognition particle receptor subunit beta